MWSVGKCDRLIAKKRSGRGYKIYARKHAAKSAGARMCRGVVHLREDYEVVQSASMGQGGDSHPMDVFVGWEARCSRCGHVSHKISKEFAEELVANFVRGEDYGGGKA